MKGRIKLAAKFDNPGFDACEEKVLNMLKSSPFTMYTCDDVKEELGLESRDIALICLRKLVKNGLAREEKSSESGKPSTFGFQST